MKKSPRRIGTGRRRPRTPASERQRLVKAWKGSSQTQREFARSHGIPYPTFCNWIRREGQAGAGGRATAGIEFEEIRLPNLGPAVPMAATTPWEAEVRWPSGLVVALAPGVAAARVRKLIQALGC